MSRSALGHLRAWAEGLVYSNVWVSFCGVCLLWSNYLLLRIPVNIYLLMLYFFGILFTYNAQRLYELNQSKTLATDSRRVWISNHLPLIKNLMLFSLFILFAFFFIIPFRVWVYMLPAAAITFLYTIPAGVTGKVYGRLREIPGIKIFLVAIVWSYTSVALIAADKHWNVFESDLGILWVLNGILCLAITLPFDIRDETIDSKTGLSTLVTRFGSNKILWFASFLLILMLLLVTFGAFLGPNQRLSLFLHGIICLLCLAMNRKFRTYELYYTGLLDGLLVLRMICLAAVE